MGLRELAFISPYRIELLSIYLKNLFNWCSNFKGFLTSSAPMNRPDVYIQPVIKIATRLFEE
jgi:hypothetical protein